MNHKFFILLVSMFLLTGCGDEPSRVSLTGLFFPIKDRKITLYANDGKILNVWEGRYEITVQNSARILKIGKKEIVLSEGIVVAEDK